LRPCLVCLLDPYPIQGLSLHGSQSLVHFRYGFRRSFRRRKKKVVESPFFFSSVCVQPQTSHSTSCCYSPATTMLGFAIDTLLAPRFGPSLDPVSLLAPIHHGMVPPSLPSFLLDVPDREKRRKEMTIMYILNQSLTVHSCTTRGGALTRGKSHSIVIHNGFVKYFFFKLD